MSCLQSFLCSYCCRVDSSLWSSGALSSSASESTTGQSIGLATDESQTPPQVSPLSSVDLLIYQNIPPRVPIIKRIPRASRYLAAQKFCSLLKSMVKENSLPSWERLLSFTSRSSFTPRQGVKRWSLSSLINKQLELGVGPPTSVVDLFHRYHARPSDPARRLRAAVSVRLEEGDFKGAIRMASGVSKVAESSDDTFTALQNKHPPVLSDFSPPSPPPEAPEPFMLVK